MNYRLHYTSADGAHGETWSVYREEYANALDAEPIDGLTVHVSRHATEAEADAEANRLQRLEERDAGIRHAALAFLHGEDWSREDLERLAVALGEDPADVEALS